MRQMSASSICEAETVAFSIWCNSACTCCLCSCWLPVLLQTVVEDGRCAAVLTEQSVVSINDLVSETSERLEFRDAVVKLSIGEHRCMQGPNTQFQQSCTSLLLTCVIAP